MRRRHPACLGLLLAIVLAAPAAAEVEGGRNLEVNHSLEFTLLEGWPQGHDVRVEVFRGARLIAGKTDRPVNSRDGTTLEINHVGGDDCWQSPDGGTPDIKPGDKVVATDLDAATTDVDYAFVRDIRFVEDPPGILTGHARGAETAAGTFDLLAPLEMGNAVMSGRRVGSLVEGDSAFLPTDLGEAGAFVKGLGGSAGEGDVSIDWVGTTSHGGVQTTTAMPAAAEPLPCGELRTTALTEASHTVVNMANDGTDLVLGGPRLPDVAVTLTFDGAPLAVNPSAAGWRAKLPAAAVGALREGEHRVVASFSDGAPADERVIVKDITPPAITAGPGPGTYAQPQRVDLRSGGGEAIRYTLDGSAPTTTSARYDGTPVPLGIGTHVLRAAAIDRAGNRGEVTLRYVIDPGAPADSGLGSTGTPAGPPGVANIGAVLQPSRSRAVSRLRLRKTLRRAAVRRSGLRAAMRLARGTTGLRVSVYRRQRSGRLKLVARTVRYPGRSGDYVVRLTGAKLRRALTPGRYVLEAAPTAAPLEARRVAFRVVG